MNEIVEAQKDGVIKWYCANIIFKLQLKRVLYAFFPNCDSYKDAFVVLFKCHVYGLLKSIYLKYVVQCILTNVYRYNRSQNPSPSRSPCASLLENPCLNTQPPATTHLSFVTVVLSFLNDIQRDHSVVILLLKIMLWDASFLSHISVVFPSLLSSFPLDRDLTIMYPFTTWWALWSFPVFGSY